MREVIDYFHTEKPAFMAACEEEYHKHRDFNFLPLEEYLFHFTWTFRFEKVFYKPHKDLFRNEFWRKNLLGQNQVEITRRSGQLDKSWSPRRRNQMRKRKQTSSSSNRRFPRRRNQMSKRRQTSSGSNSTMSFGASWWSCTMGKGEPKEIFYFW